jgi:hypothetical protein
MSQAPAQLPFGRVTPHDPGNARRSPWRPQVTRGESRVSVAGAVVVISGLQMTLPERLSPRPHWLLPALEVLLLGVLVAAQPGRMDRRSPRLRAGGLALVGLLSVANAISAALLVGELVRGGDQEPAGALLFAGVSIWTTNVLVFALWYDVRNRRLADALHQQAFTALTASPGARAYYDSHRARGATHHQALRALANRLVGILDGCLRHHTPYDETTAWAHRHPAAA